MAKKRLGPGVVLLKDKMLESDGTPDGGERLIRAIEDAIKAVLVEAGHPYLGVQCSRSREGAISCEAMHIHQRRPDYYVISVEVQFGWEFNEATVTAVITA